MGNQAGKYKVPKLDESGSASAKAQIVEPVQPITSNGENGATNDQPQTQEPEKVEEKQQEEESKEEEVKENGITLLTEEKPANGSASKDVVENGNSNGHAHKDESEAEPKTTQSKKKNKLNWITKKISFRKTKSGKADKKGDKSQDEKIIEETAESKTEDANEKTKEGTEQVENTETENTANGDVPTTQAVPEVTEPSFESIPAQEALDETKETVTASESQETPTSAENAN